MTETYEMPAVRLISSPIIRADLAQGGCLVKTPTPLISTASDLSAAEDGLARARQQ